MHNCAVVSLSGLRIVEVYIPGRQGAPGPKGDKGDPGLSAYQLAVLQGFEGTIDEWLDSLKGGTSGSASLAEMKALIEEHRQDPEAHPVATETTAGFMGPQQVQKVEGGLDSLGTLAIDPTEIFKANL